MVVKIALILLIVILVITIIKIIYQDYLDLIKESDVERVILDIIEHYQREDDLKCSIIYSADMKEYLVKELMYCYKYKRKRTHEKLEYSCLKLINKYYKIHAKRLNEFVKLLKKSENKFKEISNGVKECGE